MLCTGVSHLCLSVPVQCMPCGPGDRGRCFGPSICCGEGLGCLLGSPETVHCAEENYLLTPCQAGGKPCGSEGGRCAASGLCCDAESCTTDQSCVTEEDGYDTTGLLENGDSSDIILRLMHLAGHNLPHRIHQ
ncbi:hypothetical protein CRUP_025545 [Coryphaenoides rupestris]|nr:hypothetical protein CRUP_025545 [Coryphaenoides rupestris]